MSPGINVALVHYQKTRTSSIGEVLTLLTTLASTIKHRLLKHTFNVIWSPMSI